ncbi:hypothetical protein GOP47_0006511 [Adiantum capillus-veneris]|uniref:Uncharacterized protein n=1 Tax=Adiantum capillus-veneris TaxID=13818 RepID=A0A9D4V308_ADICA|nr:hypothetical protein GOP47_0006511 [Adiantum capillus-veneris]
MRFQARVSDSSPADVSAQHAIPPAELELGHWLQAAQILPADVACIACLHNYSLQNKVQQSNGSDALPPSPRP